MDDEIHVARVPRGLADLLPAFMANRHREVEDLRAMIAAGTLNGVADMAHRMIGVGSPYGFPYITSVSRMIKDAAQAGELERVTRLVDDLAAHLGMVRIVVVEGYPD